jgi:hypothetical protein
MLLIAAGAYANPFLGRWQVEMVFSPVPLILEFLEDGTYSASPAGTEQSESQAYSIDEAQGVIDLGNMGAMRLLTRYVFREEGVFELRFDHSLAQTIDQQMGMSMEIPPNANDLTVEFRDQFVSAIRETLLAVVIMEGQRLP